MKIDGEVTTGLGKAAYFLSQEFYTREFEKNLGFIPYPGTLNVIVSDKYLDEISEIKNNCQMIEILKKICYNICIIVILPLNCLFIGCLRQNFIRIKE